MSTGWWAQVGMVRPRARAWVDRRRRVSVPIDLACTYAAREREQLTPILGSAIALRLFLFMVPTVAMSVALIVLVVGPDGLDALLRQASVTGELAQEVNTSTDTSTSTLVVAIVITASVTNRLRADFGFAGSTTSWIVGASAFTAAWFAVMWVLPRGTPDPGAVLPGAALVGLSLTVLQWFMQFYLPSKLERSSDLTGSVGTTVAILGSMFLVGGVLASSFVLNAVIFHRIGSISATLLALPVIRRLPERFPAIVRWFDLPTHDDPAKTGKSPVTAGEGRPREQR